MTLAVRQILLNELNRHKAEIEKLHEEIRVKEIDLAEEKRRLGLLQQAVSEIRQAIGEQ